MHLVYAIDNLGSGGAQRQCAALGLYLKQEHGQEVTFLVYRESSFFSERLRRAGIPVVLLRKRGRMDPLLPWRIRRWLRAHRPDVVHAFLPLPCLWHYLATRSLPVGRRPTFIAAERSAFDLFSLEHDLARRFVYPRAEALTVNSERMVGEIEARLGVAPERIHYLPNGIDLEAWDAAAAEESPLDLEPGRFHLALVGGLRREKNHLLVLDALERLGEERRRAWQVWFVGAETGEPGYADEVRASVERRGLARTVRIVPPVERIAALMVRLDGVLLPSQYEGFPNVVLEAMASRVPVITANVGDVPNLVEHGRTGFVLDRTDAPTLAGALEALHDLDSEKRAAMGKRARARVETRYAIPLVAGRYLEFYRKLADRRGVAGLVAPEMR